MIVQRPELTLFAAVPAARTADGRLLLDDKFASGMALHARLWGGPVRAVMRDIGGDSLPFASSVDAADLNFMVTLLPDGASLDTALGRAPGLVLASADMPEHLTLGQAARARGLAVVYGIEYTLGTRLQIARLERDKSLAKRLRSMLWNMRTEKARRAVLAAADGIQMNGFPAEHDYARLNAMPLRYLDNRMSRAMMATPADRASRMRRHDAKLPLRLIHSGRLEPMKGGHLLVPLAHALRERNMAYSLDIYGTGSLADQIRRDIVAGGLSAQVRLHDPVPFEAGLVPISRREADLFVSCHIQSDPSCTYIEAMGCGLPVVGFGNRMLSALVAQSGGGWCAAMGKMAPMAAQIAALDADRTALMAGADAALSYAQAHDFEAEFDARMAHLAQVFSRFSSAAGAAPQQHAPAES